MTVSAEGQVTFDHFAGSRGPVVGDAFKGFRGIMYFQWDPETQAWLSLDIGAVAFSGTGLVVEDPTQVADVGKAVNAVDGDESEARAALRKDVVAVMTGRVSVDDFLDRHAAVASAEVDAEAEADAEVAEPPTEEGKGADEVAAADVDGADPDVADEDVEAFKRFRARANSGASDDDTVEREILRIVTAAAPKAAAAAATTGSGDADRTLSWMSAAKMFLDKAARADASADMRAMADVVLGKRKALPKPKPPPPPRAAATSPPQLTRVKRIASKSIRTLIQGISDARSEASLEALVREVRRSTITEAQALLERSCADESGLQLMLEVLFDWMGRVAQQDPTARTRESARQAIAFFIAQQQKLDAATTDMRRLQQEVAAREDSPAPLRSPDRARSVSVGSPRSVFVPCASPPALTVGARGAAAAADGAAGDVDGATSPSSTRSPAMSKRKMRRSRRNKKGATEDAATAKDIEDIDAILAEDKKLHAKDDQQALAAELATAKEDISALQKNVADKSRELRRVLKGAEKAQEVMAAAERVKAEEKAQIDSGIDALQTLVGSTARAIRETQHKGARPRLEHDIQALYTTDSGTLAVAPPLSALANVLLSASHALVEGATRGLASPVAKLVRLRHLVVGRMVTMFVEDALLPRTATMQNRQCAAALDEGFTALALAAQSDTATVPNVVDYVSVEGVANLLAHVVYVLVNPDYDDAAVTTPKTPTEAEVRASAAAAAAGKMPNPSYTTTPLDMVALRRKWCGLLAHPRVARLAGPIVGNLIAAQRAAHDILQLTACVRPHRDRKWVGAVMAVAADIDRPLRGAVAAAVRASTAPPSSTNALAPLGRCAFLLAHDIRVTSLLLSSGTFCNLDPAAAPLVANATTLQHVCGEITLTIKAGAAGGVATVPRCTVGDMCVGQSAPMRVLYDSKALVDMCNMRQLAHVSVTVKMVGSLLWFVAKHTTHSMVKDMESKGVTAESNPGAVIDALRPIFDHGRGATEAALSNGGGFASSIDMTTLLGRLQRDSAFVKALAKLGCEDQAARIDTSVFVGVTADHCIAVAFMEYVLIVDHVEWEGNTRGIKYTVSVCMCDDGDASGGDDSSDNDDTVELDVEPVDAEGRDTTLAAAAAATAADTAAGAEADKDAFAAILSGAVGNAVRDCTSAPLIEDMVEILGELNPELMAIMLNFQDPLMRERIATMMDTCGPDDVRQFAAMKVAVRDMQNRVAPFGITAFLDAEMRDPTPMDLRTIVLCVSRFTGIKIADMELDPEIHSTAKMMQHVHLSLNAMGIPETQRAAMTAHVLNGLRAKRGASSATLSLDDVDVCVSALLRCHPEMPDVATHAGTRIKWAGFDLPTRAVDVLRHLHRDNDALTRAFDTKALQCKPRRSPTPTPPAPAAIGGADAADVLT